MSWTITPQTKVPVDPYRSQVSLLLHGDGANGSTTIVDSSPTPKTVTAFGNAQISTAQSKFSGASVSFANTNASGDSNRLTIPSVSDFDLATSNFTIESWVYLNNSNGGGIVGKQRGVSSWGEYVFASLSSSRYLFFGCTTGGESGSGWTMINLTASIAVPLQSWAHVAVTRSGSVFTLWIDGASAGNATSSSSITSGSGLLSIGSSKDSGALGMNGYIDDLRITKGVARYTANFTPPTAPFPDI